MAKTYLSDYRLSLRDKGLMSLIVKLGKENMEREDSNEIVFCLTADKEKNVMDAFAQLKKYGYFGRFKDEDGKYVVFINELTEEEEYE